MNLYYRFTLRKSVSVSEFAIVMISFSGWVQYSMRSPVRDVTLDATMAYATISPYTVGYIDFGVCLPMVIGAFIGAGFGVRLHDMINTRYIKVVFGVLLLLVASRMAVEFWSH